MIQQIIVKDMIPKKIHYCWFGKGKKPESFYVFFETWKHFMPNYEIIEWNETNFDVSKCNYVAEAYQAKKYAFVSDYVRIYALRKEGGIYFDTDVEVVKSFDMLLDNDFFIGYECENRLGTSVIGSVKGFWLLDKLLEYYEITHFKKPNGDYNFMPNTDLISNYITRSGIVLDNMQKIDKGIALYDYVYFSPYNSLTNKFTKSEKTYSIHRFTGSWFPKYFLMERSFWKALNMRNMKICLRIVNLFRHGTIKGKILD